MDFTEYKALVDEWRKETVKPLIKSDFNDLEKMMEKNLPTDFIDHYLESNGEIDSDKYSFFPIKYGFSLERFMYTQKQSGVEYAKKLPFASDLYGHKYVLSLEDDSYGHVLFLTHGYEDRQEYDFVSNSFLMFMNDYVSKGKTFFN